ncbi:hypothetical protein CAPTEDRAFT_210789 [Capitella teleta]|uniref:Growth hormone-regulated TBC protein 1 n=1 Tax=Capitella teleta TaxID=283909 RepID=R7TLB9_CAPTE|nr:hypothetical protein CAPTEDRAFT_210789 [Capitella teleta]|eukprot:ELT92326.1 hypothetical protein CAPTEDRAFT_210789 [Capitella teleta]
MATSNVDPYGFERTEDFDFESYEEFMKTYLSVLSRRASRWSSDLLMGSKKVSRSQKLKRFIRKGIPSEHRPTIWMQMSGAETRRQQNPNVYRQLLQEKHDPQLVETIKTDIPRTFPDNIYFQDTPSDPQCKRAPLFNVLVALGHKNPSIGYCQGLNFIAGLLLLIVKDEEKVFWLMDTLINNMLPDYYAPDMMGVKIDSEVLGDLVKVRDPQLYAFMESAGAAWSIVCTKWLICVFADVLPIETLLRVWDCLFYEGDKVIFRVGLTLLIHNRDKILRCQHFPQIMSTIKAIVMDEYSLNCHNFLQAIFKEPKRLSRAEIQKLRLHHRAQFSK